MNTLCGQNVEWWYILLPLGFISVKKLSSKFSLIPDAEVKPFILNVHVLYTGCPRRNVPDFGRVFLMLKYIDITQNTYVQI